MAPSFRTDSLRSPRVSAEINGIAVNEVVRTNVTTAGSRKSSQFELTISTKNSGAILSWLNQLNVKIAVDIHLRTHTDDENVNVFHGLADSVVIDPINGLAHLVGRDYSSILIASTFQDTYYNQTASEIAQRIATRHGFSSSISPTTGYVGCYQCGDHSQLLLNAHSPLTNEWEILAHLSEIEQFALFFVGGTMVFAPPNDLPSSRILLAARQTIGMKFHRRLPVSDQTNVTVKSWNSWLSQPITQTLSPISSPGSFVAPGLSATQPTEIAIVRPNMTPEGAAQLASRQLNILNSRQTTVQIVMPGEVIMNPFDIITIDSEGTGFDGDYVIASIRRHFSSSGGFTQYLQGYADLPSDG